MATDEQPGGTTPRARTGPRHAAPRKPLLARLHMPAGKAVALVAMPSAMLMGMGLTPTLAQAKPAAPPNPFGDAQCAAAPDQSPEASPSASTGASTGTSASPAPDPSSKPSKSPKSPTSAEEPSPKASVEDDDASSPPPAPSRKPAPQASKAPVPPAPAPSASPSPSPSASPSKRANPLDPLGLGDKLGDLLGGLAGKKTTAPAAPAPAPPARPAPSAGSTATDPDPEPEDAPSSAPAASRAPSPGPSHAPATPLPGPSATAGPSGTPSADPSGTPSAGPEAGKPLPPCPPTGVVDEKEGHAFPNQPWYLEASRLTLTGLTYEGVRRITMVNGQKKDVLKFTADALDIQDLHQIVNSKGREYHVTGVGTNSRVAGGRITMYTEELKGKLLGLIPATQSPTSPPPLIPGIKLPIPIFFTDVKVRQGGQYGGTLTIPNLHQYLTEGTYP
ncbi:hypothetical protein [Streptomyces mashuensis]|uniref:hypothetical protein n=1 Tax=Streptomyces mashuensis TaxID=33904 RepID=UPI00167E7F93|nr:hypothetical protein [Streptomyces mashuensis]